MAATEDRELVRRMLAGEEEAFSVFFEGHFARLYRFALARLGRDDDAAEDIVQSTLCKAIKELATYRGEAALFTWLCTFCRHEISAYYRRQGRLRPESLIEDSPEIRSALESLAAAADRSAEGEIQREQIARLVQVALDSLPASYGDVLEWKYIQGMSVRQVAERMEIGLKAAESLLTRAREAFRETFTVLLGNPQASSRLLSPKERGAR
ncbi:MAG TPA: sigma-70 family RNA polymerase sigma factor [Candidatus Polarisedimenticolia bacterium]|jgi:RNA polymerase sigma-70 factor (ECF subfamily)|nr:sigma-70 family RNA polymerase sigma factor [Candidatus Polarisedimenticolia bacterium]